MTKTNLNSMEYHATDHSKFSGLIYQTDFDTEYNREKNIASRIAADWRFDEQCRKDSKLRDKQKKRKEVHSTLVNLE